MSEIHTISTETEHDQQQRVYAFYRALRERDVPVELVVYPREGHGLNEQAHLLDSDERLMRWLERYL